MDLSKLFARFAGGVAHATGTPIAFILCVLVVLAWATTGPLFGYSDTWQLVINTGTTIITFLMVFLIQNTQNRDGAAIQIKLDELILTSKAENDFIGIEKLSDKELESLRARCAEHAHRTHTLAEKAGAELHARRTGQKSAVPAKAEEPANGKPRKPRAKRPAAAKKGG